MSSFDVVVLGVGDAFSEQHRPTALLLICDDFHLSVDCPDGYLAALRSASDSTGRQLPASKIDHVLKTLTYREREIIKLRYGIGDGQTYTLEEVGRIFRVTRERVRQIEAKAIRKLQHPVRSRKLEGFLDAQRAQQEAKLR